MSKMEITIGWLYPDLMSTYGDRGNVIVLQKRCQWRGIDARVKKISLDDKPEEIANSDIIFMGGAQDQQQEIVNRDLQVGKGQILIEEIQNSKPGLYICGAYQFLGRFYRAADGTEIKGLGVFDLYTVSSKLDEKRLIGNLFARPISGRMSGDLLVGFENHGGRTYLKDKGQSLASVVSGYGNNGKDGTEGIFFNNSIGSYMHGSLLPKNPHIADFLIEEALKRKYKELDSLQEISDTITNPARSAIASRFNIQLSR